MDELWSETVNAVHALMGITVVYAPKEMHEACRFETRDYKYFEAPLLEGAVLVLHKGLLKEFDAKSISAVYKHARPLFANEVFIIYGGADVYSKYAAPIDTRHISAIGGDIDRMMIANHRPTPPDEPETDRRDNLYRSIFFLHFMKSGGTTVHSELEIMFSDGFSERRESFRKPLTEIDYANSRIISGHFSLSETLRAERDFGYLRCTILRNPADRIVSIYNFLRSHNPDTHPEILDGTHPLIDEIRAINADTPSDFFKSPVAKKSLILNNLYVNALSNKDAQFFGEVSPRASGDKDVRVAIDNLRKFDFYGTLDNILPFINSIRSDLGFGTLSAIDKRKVTGDEMTWHPWMRPVQLLTRAELPATAEPLIELDMRLFKVIDR